MVDEGISLCCKDVEVSVRVEYMMDGYYIFGGLEYPIYKDDSGDGENKKSFQREIEVMCHLIGGSKICAVIGHRIGER